jgi:hypothetical protein
MTSLKSILWLAGLAALIGSAILLDTTTAAFAQECANGVCP